MSIDVGLVFAGVLGLLVGVNPACFSNHVLTGSSVRFNLSAPAINPLQKATGSFVSSLKIGVSSVNSIRLQ
jgi:hypothetical protein